MSQGQMLPYQISPLWLEIVQDGPRDLHLKFGGTRVSNSLDIADIEFVWWRWVCKVIFVSNPALAMLG